MLALYQGSKFCIICSLYSIKINAVEVNFNSNSLQSACQSIKKDAVLE